MIEATVSTHRRPTRLPRLAFLKQVPPTLAWVLCAMALVLSWGLIDPGHTRQRMDWSIGDRWLAHRTPPSLHNDIVLVLEDDVAAAELGHTNARHRRARALRQLRRLRARTVVFDFLLLDTGSDVSFYNDEAPYDGLPTRQLVQDTLQKIYQHDAFHPTHEDPLTLRQTHQEARVEQLYTEDALQQKALAILAGSGTQSINIVLASHFRHVDNHDSPLTQPLVNELTLNPRHPDTNSLAKATHLSPSTVVEHFEDVVAIAAHEIVRNNRKTALEIVAIGNSLMANPLRRALDKTKPVLTEALDRSTFTTQHHSPNQLPTLDHLELPRWQFAEHAILAFSDSELDDDFVMRRLKTSQAFNDTDNTTHNASQVHPSPVRSMVHQAVAAYQLHTTPKTSHDNSRIEAPFQTDDLIINWPLNGQASWGQQLDRRDTPVDRHPDPATRSQVVRVSELLQLAQLDADVHATRFEIRLRSTHLVKALGVTSSIPDQVETLETALEAAVTGDQPTSDLAILHKTLELSVAELLDDKSLKRQLAHLDAGPAQWADQLTELIDTELPARIRVRDELVQNLTQHIDGKLCLVGQVKTGLVDLHNTPIGRLPGIIVNAAALNTLLLDNPLRIEPLSITLLVTIGLMLGAAVLFFRLDVVPATVSVAPLLLVVGWMHHGLLAWQNIITQPVLPLVGIVACFSAVTIRKWWHDNLARRRIRRAFEFYLHPTVVGQVAERPEALQLGGAAAELSILFSDIRGFTTIAERLPDTELTMLINEYLTAMTEVVFDNNGTVDKYIGDAIMAFYGAPIPSTTHPLQACRTAIRMSQRLNELRQQWQDRGLPTIRIRIGINTDTVRVGNFGSNLRFDYTIIGDGVNLASRLEGANEQYGTETLISHSTWEQVHDQLITREIDLIQVKGRQEPTRIYELLAESSAPAEQLERIAQFDSAITLYREQRFQEALDQFSELADVDPNDQPTRIYIERCRTLIQTPPTSAWDGVFVMTSK